MLTFCKNVNHENLSKNLVKDFWIISVKFVTYDKYHIMNTLKSIYQFGSKIWLQTKITYWKLKYATLVP